MADIHTGMEVHIDVSEMSLCPLCESGIEQQEEIAFVFAHGLKCIAHKNCVDDVLND